MKKILFFPFALLLSLFFVSCEKEYSVDTGGTPNSGLALFSLLGGSSSCTGFAVSGTYKAGVAMDAANTVVLNVQVDSIGAYSISTNTVNGISFSGSGAFTATGPQTITLSGTGTPLATGDFDFSTGAGSCSFTVTFVPNGGSSSGTAVYTYSGGTSACTGAILGGTYTQGTALTPSNTVSLQIDVTTAGTYNISTAVVNGISFSGSGTFSATGPQTLTLTGTGTPAAGGNFNFVPGTTGCTFSVTVVATVAACKDCLYYPSCVGSKYTFADTINGTPYVLVSEYISSVDTTIGGVVFQKIKSNTTPAALAGNSTIYYNCSGGVTTLKAYNAVTIGGTSVVESTVRPIKENAAIGDTWTDSNPYPGVPGTTYESAFTIAEKGISRTLAGVTYNDVIHIHLETGSTTGGVYSASSTTEYYYAKGIGLIETETTLLSTGQVRLHQVLQTYFIP